MTDRALTFLPFAAGVLAGALWNAANLWCLSRAVGAWLNPQRTRRQQIGWFVVKFPLLYAAAFGLMQIPGVSLIGFGIGFTVVLGSAVFVALKALRQSQHSLPAHGG
ncbi:MAG: hypothetical protein HY353_04815 [Candidatus Omnitrophica bacterium]|nr:hypothetical protein [Candidatus Omnitrophota bacterium]